MSNKQRKTVVMPYDDMGLTTPVMRCMSPLSEYGVSLTDVIGQAADCALTPRSVPVEAHVCENIDAYYFDQSDDQNDDHLTIDGRRVEFGEFHELLSDAVSSVYDHVERMVCPVFRDVPNARVRTACNKPGSNRVFMDIEIGED